MPLQIQGNAGVVAEVDANRCQLAVSRPADVGALGSYSALVSTGTMAAGLAAAAPIFSVRWLDSSGKLMIVKRVSVAVTNAGTAFTAGVGFIDVAVARAFTASDTGGAAVTLTGNNCKRRTSFGTSLIAGTEMRIATTGTLTAGTRTVDGNAVAGIRFSVSATASVVMLPMTLLWCPDTGAAEYPLILAQNEGVILRATVPATGTWTGDVTVDWMEVASF